MNNFNDLGVLIRSNWDNHQQNYYNCIPFDVFPKLEQVVPGIIQGVQYLLTGSTGCAKSKISRYLFLHNPYQYVKTHPDSGIDLDIFYFSLEESREKIYLSELARVLRTKYKVSFSVNQLRSVGKNNTIPKELFPKIKECEPEVQTFMDKVRIYGKEESNPFGVYNIMRNFAHKVGRFYHKDGRYFTEHERVQLLKGEGDVYKSFGGYKLNNPRHYIICLYDNMNIMKTESGKSLHECMTKLSSDYFLDLKNIYKQIPVAVHQQEMSKERMEFTSKGASIEKKLEPSLDGLGDNKMVGRDFEVVFGLFNPARYGIDEHEGYDITKLKDNYRDLKVLKNRDDFEGKRVALFFDGACDYFRELPHNREVSAMNGWYDYAKKLNETRFKK